MYSRLSIMRVWCIKTNTLKKVWHPRKLFASCQGGISSPYNGEHAKQRCFQFPSQDFEENQTHPWQPRNAFRQNIFDQKTWMIEPSRLTSTKLFQNRHLLLSKSMSNVCCRFSTSEGRSEFRNLPSFTINSVSVSKARSQFFIRANLLRQS